MIELPQAIWTKIYSYDSTYRLIYNDVIDEFNQINNFWGLEFTHPKIEEAIIPILPTLIDSEDDLINDVHLRFDIESVKKIFYFGSIGPGHGLTELIKASVYLDKNIKLTIYGWVVNKDYYLKVSKLIKKISLKQKVKMKIDLKDFEWKQEMIDSDLGIALYDNSNLSHKFMFSASQKINAYIAAKLPILISNSKDNRNFIKKYKCGICTILQPNIIAKNINLIFKNKNKYNKLKKNCEKSFKNEFNFENQYRKNIQEIRLNYSYVN